MDLKGLLYSQIGYELDDDKRALIRSTNEKELSGEAVFKVYDYTTKKCICTGRVGYWGEKWGSFWWAADFSAVMEEGSFTIEIIDDGSVKFASEDFRIGKNILWDETIDTVALEQFEARVEASRYKIGWKDCGSDWREVNSHATAVIGLCDMLDKCYDFLSGSQIGRLVNQMVHGCDYIARCQDRAHAIGHPKGAIVHEMPNQMTVIPGDIIQSCVAFSWISRLTADLNEEKSIEYYARAVDAYEYIIDHMKPYGRDCFGGSNHGAPQGFETPDEFMTRDILMMMWAGESLWAAGKTECKQKVIDWAQEVMARQVKKENAQGGLYGHFYTFGSCDFTEKANIHHHVGHDTGGTFPFYILPFMNILTRWYDHIYAGKWKETINDFAYGFFLPACRSNPFYLLPEGYFNGEGLLNFCGPWHGMNTSIAFGASLALQLFKFTGDKAFRSIATGNIQWIAGLNSGIHSESFESCYVWKEDIPEGIVLPFSQIYGFGKRFTGNWSGIKGTIPNGFANCSQFKFDVEPKLRNDIPLRYTDEDWIPHSAGWISCISHLLESRFNYIDRN